MRLYTYLSLAKPRLVMGNLLNAFAAFSYATPAPFYHYFGTISALLGALGLLIASAAIINNTWDIAWDREMTRTRSRSLVAGDISIQEAQWLAFITFSLSTALFFLLLPTKAYLWSMAGLISYLCYTWLKPHYGFVFWIGAFAGIAPVLVGLAAARPEIDLREGLLIGVFFVWQVMHFDAIALYHRKDYQNAAIPLRALALTPAEVVQEIRWSSWLLCALSLVVLAHSSMRYVAFFLFLCARVALGLKNDKGLVPGSEAWAKLVFQESLALVAALDGLMILDGWFKT